jgi:glycosyltransferase involved in cell wall biosynthesis
MSKIILVANTDWYLYNFRASLMNELRLQGSEVVLVSPSGEFCTNFQEWGIRWIPWDVGRKTLSPIQEMSAISGLMRIYHQERPDLVHHHTIKPVLYGTIAARMNGIPAVINAVTGRGYVFLGEDRRARLLRFLIKPLYRLFMRSSSVGMIFENQTDREFFVKHQLVNYDQTWLVESVGVDPERFQPQPEPEGEVVILLPARMLWDKGIGVLVEAARLLKKWGIPVRVVLAGPLDPGNPSAIPEETIHSWQAEGIVEWLGWQKDMENIYAQSHIVTLPSFHEGVPTVLIEAAACGRPLVATDIPGCRAVIKPEENGLLVPPRDAQALANALRRLTNSPELRQRMGMAAHQRVLEKFTDQQVNRATIEIYHQLLA